jgi:hypothetical protein
MTNKINPHPARPFIIQIPIQPQRLQMPLKLPSQQRRRLPTPDIARLLAAQQDQRLVWTRARRQVFDGGGCAFG